MKVETADESSPRPAEAGLPLCMLSLGSQSNGKPPLSPSPTPPSRTASVGMQPVTSAARLSQIRPHLFLSSLEGAQNVSQLSRRNVGHVVSALTHPTTQHVDKFSYTLVPVVDRENADIGPYFAAVSQAIDEVHACGLATLVHCEQGISRSPTLVIAHLMRSEHMTLSAAFHAVKALRDIIEPNPTFLQALRDWEMQLHGEAYSNAPLTKVDSVDLPGALALWRELVEVSAAPSQPASVYEPMAAVLASRPNPGADMALLARRTFESFSSREPRHQSARAALGTTFHQAVTVGGMSRETLLHGLNTLLDTRVWQDFKLDVPRGREFACNLLVSCQDHLTPRQLQALHDRA